MLFGFRNIAIIAKIAVPATIVAVVSIGIVLYASLAVTHLSDTAAALVDQNATRVQFVLQAESNFNSAAVSEKNVILSAADEKAAKANIRLTARRPTPPSTRSAALKPSPTTRISVT
jgi:methyl-accepting chemotaxis protein